MKHIQDNQAKLTLQQEVNLIFSTVFHHQIQLKPKALLKVKEAMKQHAQSIVSDALKRAVRRDAPLSYLEESDLLWAIERRGQKYRNKVGRSLINQVSTDQFGQSKKMNINDDEEEERELVDEQI